MDSQGVALVQELALAALLHDVGKFAQRAEADPERYAAIPNLGLFCVSDQSGAVRTTTPPIPGNSSRTTYLGSSIAPKAASRTSPDGPRAIISLRAHSTGSWPKPTGFRLAWIEAIPTSRLPAGRRCNPRGLNRSRCASEAPAEVRYVPSSANGTSLH